MVVTFRDDFRQLKDCWEDDAFVESVLGSQGNQGRIGTFCFGNAFWW
jgi:hypothetical protein